MRGLVATCLMSLAYLLVLVPDVVRVPALVGHYLEHKHRTPDLSVADFLELHYGNKEHSGNALVNSIWSREETIRKVADICRRKFGFDKPIFAPTAAEWAAMIKNDPFPDKAEGKHVHAVLLADKPEPSAMTKLKALAVGDEDIKLVKGVCYIHTPNGFGTSKLAEKFDKGLGVVNTARNWNSVVKLHELAQGLAER